VCLISNLFFLLPGELDRRGEEGKEWKLQHQPVRRGRLCRSAQGHSQRRGSRLSEASGQRPPEPPWRLSGPVGQLRVHGCCLGRHRLVLRLHFQKQVAVLSKERIFFCCIIEMRNECMGRVFCMRIKDLNLFSNEMIFFQQNDKSFDIIDEDL
jgi:hypothetical protein